MRRRGFTLIELVVVLSALAFFLGFGLERLLRFQELGERAAVEQNLAAIRLALTMKFAAYLTSGRAEGIEAEVGRNPVNLLARPPEGYLGELSAPEVASLPRASWYFDRESGELVYLPARRRYLSADAGPPDMLRFRIALAAADPDRPGEPRALRQPLVAAVEPFVWSIGQ